MTDTPPVDVAALEAKVAADEAAVAAAETPSAAQIVDEPTVRFSTVFPVGSFDTAVDGIPVIVAAGTDVPESKAGTVRKSAEESNVTLKES